MVTQFCIKKHSIMVLFLSIMFDASPVLSANIVALVNDRLITRNDTEIAFRQLLLETGLKESANTRENFYNDAVQNLVRRELQRSEIQRNLLNVSEIEIDRRVQDITRNLNLEPDAFNALLSKNNIPRDFFIDSVRTNIGWNMLIRQRYQRDLRISDSDVRAEIARLFKNREEAAFNLDIILLNSQSTGEPAQVERAHTLVADIRKGADFNNLARAFSSAPGAQNGGALGWVPVNTLSKETQNSLGKLSQRGITIATIPEGVAIFRLNGFRSANPKNYELLTLSQILFENSAQAKEAAQGMMTCEERTALSEKLGALQAQTLPPLGHRDLSPDLRGAVAALTVGKAAGPFLRNQQSFILALCSVEQRSLPEKEYRTIRNGLFARQFSAYSRLYLRELWFSAVIDIRAGDITLDPLNS